jgi:hypothetical protein
MASYMYDDMTASQHISPIPLTLSLLHSGPTCHIFHPLVPFSVLYLLPPMILKEQQMSLNCAPSCSTHQVPPRLRSPKRSMLREL